MIRVAVLGAAGKMGRAVCAAVTSDPDLELVAAIAPAGGQVEGVECATTIQAAVDNRAEVAVDFTRPDAVMENIRWCLSAGIHCVVGTTGLSESDLDEIADRARSSGTNVFVAPNFSIGAVLMMRLSAQAARHLGSCEVIELHHDQKLDAPSGTAARTAALVADAWRQHGKPAGGESPPAETNASGPRGAEIHGVRVHSIRLPGLVAHQEVVFGGPGQTLTIRHDSTDRSSFMPGVLLAVKAVGGRPGLTVGLEQLLDL